MNWEELTKTFLMISKLFKLCEGHELYIVLYM